ncbi:AAA family ATPase [bacterium]|nr:AAA family ATPase [bacterium]
MFKRIILPIKSNSFFLFGARGTGKSTFLKHYFQKEKTLWFDLLDFDTEDSLQRNPQAFAQEIEAKKNKVSWVVVDEVQKIPALLNLVHKLIETTKIKFALTGSSARKLKRGSANLLAGRAFVNNLFPLTHIEIKKDFQLDSALKWGTLPKIFQLETDNEKKSFLKTYAQTYLKEEVWAEHLIRNLDPFRRFLEISTQSNSEILNYSNISKDVGADVKTVQSYFQILEDTLLGFFLEPYHKSIRKQQRESPKFYYFDTGVKAALSRTLTKELLHNTYAYGKAFEHFLITEIYRLNEYYQKDYKLSYLRTKDQAEIDLIVERPGLKTVLIEIKSSAKVDERDTHTLERFIKDFSPAEAFVFSQDPKEKKIGNILALPWQKGLTEIGLTS